jgi:phosphatidylglycerol:prolipoprotein diacylglycerol transferase
MLPTIQVGPLSLQVPGFVLLVGLWIGLSLSERRAKQRAENPSDLYNLVFISLVSGLLGARLSYAVAYPDAFTGNLWSLVSINPGLLDPVAGILIAIAAAAVYILRKKLSLWSTLDALTPLFAVMAIAIGISHFVSGSSFGKPTELPFGIWLWGELRHPTQVYEIILSSIILVALYFIDRTSWNRIPGNLFLSFISLTSISRLLIESFRGDSMLVSGGFRAAQVVAWIVLAICLAILARRLNAAQKAELTSK